MNTPWRTRRRSGLRGVLPIVTILLAGLLGACSANELAPGAALQPRGDTGLAVLSLTRSGWRDFDLFVDLKGPGQWAPRPIILRAKSFARDWKGGPEWKTTSVEDPEGRLVVLQLKPGTYRIDRWNGDSQRDGFNGNGYLMYPASPLDMTFDVKPGELTYLGELHFALPDKPNWLANLSTATYRIEIKDQHERDLALLRNKYPHENVGTPRTDLIRFAQAGAPLRYYIQNYTDTDPIYPTP